RAEHEKPARAVVDELHAAEVYGCGTRARRDRELRTDEDSMNRIVRHDRAQHGKMGRAIGLEQYAAANSAVPGERANGAVLDRQRAARGETDAIAAAEADALDGEAAQADRIGAPGTDGDARDAAGDQHAGFADPVIGDADRLVDGERAVAA